MDPKSTETAIWPELMSVKLGALAGCEENRLLAGGSLTWAYLESR